MTADVEGKKLAGHLAVVTGGASGSGAAICREFVLQGACVVIADRNIEAATRLAAQLGGPDTIRALPVDISSSTTVANLEKEVSSLFGLWLQSVVATGCWNRSAGVS